ncbi:hypothetical protein HNR74_001530 [Flammeovirga kamogawensis]|nr:hypothetical protein [Flammeovirga kamogawensis]
MHWHFSNKEAADATRKYFNGEDVKVKVHHTPVKR